MLGLDYGSDDSDNESNAIVTSSAETKAPKSTSTLASSAKASASASGLALPAPRNKRRAPAIFTVSAPEPSTEEKAEEDRPAKKPRLGPAGKSSLLSMLPAPSQPAPVVKAPRVLGGGASGSGGTGLVFHSATDSQFPAGQTPASELSTTFLPPSLAKGKEKGNTSTVSDFFSLGSSTPVVATKDPIGPKPPSLTISSAPVVKEYVPPEPSATDPYPGYYQLPSGQWAAYDRDYYQKWWLSIQQPGLAEQAGRGWENADEDKMLQVNAMDEVDRARAEREEQKALTAKERSVASAPKMTVNATKTNNVARSRHQLSTLLLDAYQNREALEEQIAQAKRNRKEAGNKYGF